MKHKYFFSTIFIIIIIIASVSLVHAYRPGKGKGTRADMGFGASRPERGACKKPVEKGFGRCLGELELTPEQISKLRSLEEEHLEKRSKMKADMEQYRERKRSMLNQGTDVTEEQIQNLVDEGAELWKVKETEMLRHTQQILDLLNQEQRERLNLCEGMRGHGRSGGPWRSPELLEEE